MIHNSPVPEASRILALDVGARRIGLAVTDPLRIIVTGLDTLSRQSKRLDFEHIASIIEEYGVSEIVVGHPVRMGGEASVQTGKVTAFADELRQKFGLPVHLWDERLTSVAAEEILNRRKRSLKERISDRRSGATDRLSAIVILQSYLDSTRNQ